MGTVTYTYDGDGKRVKKAAGSPSQYDRLYWYGPGGQVLAESELDGDIISEFIYFGGMRIARRDVSTGNVYYFLSDRLGNARVLTNASGTVVEESDYYPFGQERVINGSGTANNYKYTSHERDTESGLDHTLERQYSCNTGRWISPDRIRGNTGDPQSWNRYRYAGNNPTNRIDPDGAQDGTPCPPGTVPNPDFTPPRGGPRCSPLEPWGPRPFINLDAEDWGVIYREPYTINSLLDDVKYDIVAGMDDDCARAVSQEDDMDTDTFLQRMSNMNIKHEWLGTPRGETYYDDGSVKTFQEDSPPLARTNPLTNSITINASISWLNPHNVNVIGQHGGQWYDLAAAIQAELEATNPLTKHQLLAHTLLHEMGHEFAGIFGSHNAIDSPAFNKRIWNACQGILGPEGP